MVLLSALFSHFLSVLIVVNRGMDKPYYSIRTKGSQESGNVLINVMYCDISISVPLAAREKGLL